MLKAKFSENSVSSSTMTDQVAAMVKEVILKGEFNPGDRLNEVHLSEALKISRSPIREAIQRLSNEGLLVLVPRKGAFIRKLAAKEIEDIFEVREPLEAKAAALAAQRASEADMDEMAAFLDKTESALANKTYSKFPLDFDFHMRLASLSKNTYLYEKIHEINATLLLVRYRSGESGRAMGASLEHRKVFEYVRCRDAAKAAVTLELHLRQAKEKILRVLA